MAGINVLSDRTYGNYIGGTDLEVWEHVCRSGLQVRIDLQHPNMTHRAGNGRFSIRVLRVPPIPSLNWIVLNTILLLDSIRGRWDLCVCWPRTALVGSILRLTGRTSRLLLDIRSVPVNPSRVFGRLEKLEMKLVATLAAYDALSAISEGTIELVRNRYGIKSVPSVVWGSGVDLTRFNRGVREKLYNQRLPEERPLQVVYHGTLSRDRGLIELVKSLLLVDRRVDLRLTLLGGGKFAAELSHSYRQLINQGKLELRDGLPYSDVPAFLATADVGVLPLPNDEKWFYQAPLKLLEYLAMGLMVVATDIPCHQGYGPAVKLVPTNSPSDLAAGIEEIARMSQGERRTRAQDSFEIIKDRTWAKQADVLVSFIQEKVIFHRGD